jgi:hypothetical protein
MYMIMKGQRGIEREKVMQAIREKENNVRFCASS